ncbi:hypothetical protein MTR_1g103060 [Medicago truncatula]|uniref:Uncharacterized protein n=1 Tax=Medicago truncatula TaxID=3880 RepID=A0A072VQW4_MEDTR|nr:hypothetical protein MTR_1g103060 [Medicago truncatula]
MEQVILETKKVVVQVARLTRHIGLEVQRPVIPPLTVKSRRCPIGPTLNLERAGRHGAATNPTWQILSHVPSPSCPHLSYKLKLPSSASWQPCQKII